MTKNTSKWKSGTGSPSKYTGMMTANQDTVRPIDNKVEEVNVAEGDRKL